MRASLLCSANKPILLKGLLELRVQVKFQSNEILPLGKV